jgi:hypothetical protein
MSLAGVVRGALTAIVLCALCTAQASAERWTKTSSQSQPCERSGFSSVVQEDNEPIIGENTHKLTCTGCGIQVCDWTTHPLFGNTPNDIGDTIDDRVANGYLTGSEVTTMNGLSWFYTWSYAPSTSTLQANIWIP